MENRFRAVVLVVTLCFAKDTAGLLAEARRVLSPDGPLAIGIVPLNSACGSYDRRRAGPAIPSTNGPTS
ncbi:class I SAM-dependent methyltransferase [Acidiferrimicrobium sp. IK]|nr:class I SAM-dependent methyltransferase [Acidiferrimicrobium sp. IK]